MMRIAVCDDNADFLLSEITMIEKWSEQSGIPVEIYRFDNGDSLIAKNASVGMDIIFLDIIMPASKTEWNDRQKSCAGSTMR